jgi:hypothetical protein
MGRQIIKQSFVNGRPFVIDGEECDPDLFAIWSTVVDDFTYINCTRDELLAALVRDATEEIIAIIDRQVGPDTTRHANKTFEEAIETAKRIHGNKVFDGPSKG